MLLWLIFLLSLLIIRSKCRTHNLVPSRHASDFPAFPALLVLLQSSCCLFFLLCHTQLPDEPFFSYYDYSVSSLFFFLLVLSSFKFCVMILLKIESFHHLFSFFSLARMCALLSVCMLNINVLAVHLSLCRVLIFLPLLLGNSVCERQLNLDIACDMSRAESRKYDGKLQIVFFYCSYWNSDLNSVFWTHYRHRLKTIDLLTSSVFILFTFRANFRFLFQWVKSWEMLKWLVKFWSISISALWWNSLVWKWAALHRKKFYSATLPIRINT